MVTEISPSCRGYCRRKKTDDSDLESGLWTQDHTAQGTQKRIGGGNKSVNDRNIVMPLIAMQRLR